MNIVDVHQLFVHYPAPDETQTPDWVLKDINFAVQAGEFIVLSGFSGAGKSSLLFTLNGVANRLLKAKIEGQVVVFGQQVANLEMGQISQKVGSVLQDFQSQIFNVRVDDELAFGCENLGLPPQEIETRIQQYAALMRLVPDRLIEHLSGGETQRLSTSAVLAMQHDLILLDEPLANMDTDSAQILLLYLKSLTEKGKAVILVEHRLDLVLPYCTRMLWLEDGVLIDDLPKDAAISKYASLFQAGQLRIRSNQTAELISIRGATMGYKKQSVLQDINLTIQEAEAIVILGENGSGKTTLLRCLAEISKPMTGTICFSPLCKNGNTRKQVGYVYQNPNYMLFMDTVFKEVDFQSESSENTEAFLELFNITHLKDRHPLSLSEGQKRLVTIAAAAAMKPKVLLLDEPTVGQDYKGLERLLKTLEIMHQKNNTCIVLVTHDFRCASAFGERIIWLAKGGIKADGGHELVSQYFKRYLE